MKIFITLFLTLAALTIAKADWQSNYSELLGKYVEPSGVDYDAWHGNKTDMAKIQRVVEGIADANRPTGGKYEQLAFYINAYNAWILYHVLDRYPYSNQNFLKRKFFFSRDIITVHRQKMSFEHLEHEIIRGQFDEPRIHFALNCASVSCPPLIDRAYRGETLNSTLTNQTVEFINSSEGVKLSEDGQTAYFSAIFKWFSEDFKDGDIKAYINQYLNPSLGENVEIEYQNYNWARNEAK